jgi:hypothetical protein
VDLGLVDLGLLATDQERQVADLDLEAPLLELDVADLELEVR